jgi:lipopolysaccharide export system protein LptA
MNRVKIYIVALVFLFTCIIHAQEEDRTIHLVGDSLYGKIVNGESVREVHGHVVITQGAVRITCDKAIQYIARNDVELIGNVIITQDSIIIKTERGFYYGNTKISYSQNNVDLTDGHIRLKAINGYYYFDEKRSYFYDMVKLNDGLSNLFSDRLTYYNSENKSVAVGRVKVNDTTSTIFADSLIHFRDTKISFGFNNIRIYNASDKLAIFGDFLEDYGKKDYSKVYGNPVVVRIDTTDKGKLDTLVISARMMESYSDSSKRLVATDSVKIVRGDFASANSRTFYFQKGDMLQTFRRESDEVQPVIWNDSTQLTGDSVYIYMKKNHLDYMNIVSNASIITFVKNNGNRYDQISGKNIKLFFGRDGLERTKADGNVLSIYYMFEDNEPNGLLESSSERAVMFFKDKAVSNVKLYGKPLSDYHPENTIKGKEKDHTIPTFKLYSNKPTKKKLFNSRKDILYYLIKDAEFYGAKFNPTQRKP